jgi:hypothetical protein
MTNKQTNKTALQSDIPAPATLRTAPSQANSGCGGTPHVSRWTGPEVVFIDLELPHLAIARALDQADDAGIWSECRRSRNQGMYLEWLGSLAGSYSYEHPHARDPSRRTTSHLMLVAVPYLLPVSDTPVPVPDPDRKTAAAMVQCLQAWIGYQQHATVMLEPASYQELCRWSPVTQRERLQLLARRKPVSVAPWSPTEVKLPQGFPTLSFLVGGVSRWLAHPELPEAGLAGSREWQLRSQLAGHLAYLHQQPVQAHDLRLPAPFAAAVLEGLRMWVAEVARLQLARSWQMHVRQDDLVLLELGCAEEEQASVILPLRLHQIGPCGLELLMQDLQQEIGPATITERASA